MKKEDLVEGRVKLSDKELTDLTEKYGITKEQVIATIGANIAEMNKGRARRPANGFGVLFRELRDSSGWSQEELGEELGLHPEELHGIEEGDDAPLDVNAVLQAALSMQLLELELAALLRLSVVWKVEEGREPGEEE